MNSCSQLTSHFISWFVQFFREPEGTVEYLEREARILAQFRKFYDPHRVKLPTMQEGVKSLRFSSHSTSSTATTTSVSSRTSAITFPTSATASAMNSSSRTSSSPGMDVNRSSSALPMPNSSSTSTAAGVIPEPAHPGESATSQNEPADKRSLEKKVADDKRAADAKVISGKTTAGEMKGMLKEGASGEETPNMIANMHFSPLDSHQQPLDPQQNQKYVPTETSGAHIKLDATGTTRKSAGASTSSALKGTDVGTKGLTNSSTPQQQLTKRPREEIEATPVPSTKSAIPHEAVVSTDVRSTITPIPAADLLICSSCKEGKRKSKDFSKTQASKGVSAKCAACIADPVASAAAARARTEKMKSPTSSKSPTNITSLVKDTDNSVTTKAQTSSVSPSQGTVFSSENALKETTDTVAKVFASPTDTSSHANPLVIKPSVRPQPAVGTPIGPTTPKLSTTPSKGNQGTLDANLLAWGRSYIGMGKASPSSAPANNAVDTHHLPPPPLMKERSAQKEVPDKISEVNKKTVGHKGKEVVKEAKSKEEKNEERLDRNEKEKTDNDSVATKRSARKSDASLASPRVPEKDDETPHEETLKTSKGRKSSGAATEESTKQTNLEATTPTIRSSSRIREDVSSKDSNANKLKGSAGQIEVEMPPSNRRKSNESSQRTAPSEADINVVATKKSVKTRISDASDEGSESRKSPHPSRKRMKGSNATDEGDEENVDMIGDGMDIEVVATKSTRAKTRNATKDSISTSSSPSSSVKGSGSQFHHPYIEDIDLRKELIILRNPSDSVSNIGNFIISDDEGKNKFHFPQHVEIQPKGVLHLYCCAKGLDKKILEKGEPYMFWLNKDGKHRMKNVLNDDGDKIHLMNSHEKVVATCEKISPDADPIVVKHIVHHRGETTVRSNYSLRDGSSLQHNPNNAYVIDEKVLHGEESMHQKSQVRGKRRRS